ESLACELVAYHVAGGIDGRTCTMDRGGTFRVPTGALVARVLEANGAASCTSEDGSIHCRIACIAAPVGAGHGARDGPYVFWGQPEYPRHSIAGEVRLLRAGPDCDLVILDLDHRTSWAHAGMRLKRPLVLGLDHTRGSLESLIDVADFLGDL